MSAQRSSVCEIYKHAWYHATMIFVDYVPMYVGHISMPADPWVPTWQWKLGTPKSNGLSSCCHEILDTQWYHFGYPMGYTNDTQWIVDIPCSNGTPMVYEISHFGV